MDKIKYVLIPVLGFLVLTMLSPFVIVDTGHRGIVTKFGEVIGEPLEEGMHFRMPFVDHIIEIDTRTQRQDDKTVTYTKDVQQVTVASTVNYNLKRTAAGDVYKDVGVDWENIILSPALNGIIKETIGKWDAVDLVENRDKAANDILESLKVALDPRGVTISNFEIIDVKFNKQFEEAVEAKVTAVQHAAEAKNKTIQVEEEARQRVIAAKADAEALRIKNIALAQSPRLIEYEAVKKWDGKLPVQMIPGSSVPFINLRK